MAPPLDVGNRFSRALEYHLDPAVGQIAGRSLDPEPQRHVAAARAEPHPLDEAGHQQPSALDRGPASHGDSLAWRWQDHPMADERGLEGLDPYALQDVEAQRIGDWLAGLDDEGMTEPSACEGWSRRDVLAHLLATEEYHQACLEGTVRQLIDRLVSAGATSLEEMNAMGVASHADTPAPELLARWREQNERTRAGFRAADGTEIDSSVGPYPGRAQAFHVAYELAIHADDVDAPVEAAERDERQSWLAAVSRFALTEVKEDVSVEPDGDDISVRKGELEVRVDRDSFVAGVSGRSGARQLDPLTADLLSLGH